MKTIKIGDIEITSNDLGLDLVVNGKKIWLNKEGAKALAKFIQE